MHLVSVHTDIRRGKLSDETKTRHLTKKWYEQRYAPQLNFLLLDAYSDFLSGVLTTLLRSGGDTNGHKECFHILVSCTAHKINISGILCCRARTRVISKWIMRAPSPRCRSRSSPPVCSQDRPDAAHVENSRGPDT